MANKKRYEELKKTGLQLELAKSTEHNWIEYSSGELDCFAYNPEDPHNGPKCKDCGYGYCWHCGPPTFSCPGK